MSVLKRAVLVSCVVLPLAGAGVSLHSRDETRVAPPSIASQVRTLQVPIGFENNRGQVDARVDYLARGPGYSLFLTASEAVFRLLPSAQASQSTVLRLSLIGANKAPVAQGEDKQQGVSHYIHGAQSRTAARFGKVRYTGVYPGIDVVYYGNQRQLEYDFIVAAGADPKRIGLRFGGTHAVKLDASGNLVLSTEGGDVVQHKPIAYQTIDGERHAVDSRYRVLADHSVAFEIGAYDRAHALVIDPVVVYRAPFDGNAYDNVTSIAVDAAGNTYVTGYTDSVSFPVTPDARQPENAGGSDVFVAKINAAGDAFVWNTFLGGSGGDNGRGIGVDADGNVVIAGDTNSPDFPLAAAAQPQRGGVLWDSDAFVTRLSADGSTLIYSTYLGGTESDRANDVAVAADGTAYVVGATISPGFPRTFPGGCPAGVEGTSCSFVSKFRPDGTIAYTRVTTPRSLAAVAVNDAGVAYFGGAFTVRTLSPDAMGGMSRDVDFGNVSIKDIAIDADGGTYVLASDPTNAAAINSDLTDNTGHVVCKLQPNFMTYVYCAHVGLSKSDTTMTQTLTSIAVDGDGAVVVTGSNNRGDADLGNDAFVQGLTPSGRSQRFMRSLGQAMAPADRQAGASVAVDPAGNIYVAGTANGLFPTASFVTRVTPADWRIVGAGDVDGDGRADLFVHNRGLEQLDTWSMHGATRTDAHSASIPLQYRVAANADFNGDGRTDVLWYDEQKTSVWIWQAEDDGTFSIHFVADHPPEGWTIAGAGDVDGDGNADILWHNRSMEELDWWLMDGAELRFIGGQYVPSQYSVVQVADFSGDDRADLVWQDDARTTLWLWEADVSDFAIRFIDAYPRAGWKLVGAGDIDGDDRADLLWHNTTLQQLDWWTMHGAARVATASRHIPAMYRVDAVADFDGDHRADIVWRDDDRTTLWLWRAVPGDFVVQYIGTHPQEQ